MDTVQKELTSLQCRFPGIFFLVMYDHLIIFHIMKEEA